MRVVLWIVAACLAGWLAWTAAFDRDSKVYWGARMAFAWARGSDLELVTRQTDPGGRTEAAPSAGTRIGVYVAFGQSNSANFGTTGYVVRERVFNFFNGKTYVYEDPALGADGDGGSVWGRVGDRLVEAGVHDAVVFAPAGFASRTIRQLGEGEVYDDFMAQYRGAMAAYGHVDGILFHQGEQNHRALSGDDYADGFRRFIERVREDGVDAPFYLSQASYCGNSIDLHLLAVQDVLITATKGVLRGPNTDTLTDDRYRRDRCHFSSEGLDAFAGLWLAAILAASED